MNDELQFDEATHTYTLGGTVLPGVTSILKPISTYGSLPPEVLAKAAARGTAVHKATELSDLGTLDYESLDDELIPYLMGWEKFVHDMKPIFIGIETRTYHPKLLYAGSIDREVIIKGSRDLIDIKSSVAMMPSVGPQLAGYKHALNSTRDAKDKIKRRWGFQVKKDGTAELHPYTDEAGDLNAFMACLAVTRFLARHA